MPSPMQRNRYNRYRIHGFQPLRGVFGPQLTDAFRQGLISAMLHPENHFPSGAVVSPQPNHPVELERLILAARTPFADRQILPECTRAPRTRRVRVVEQCGSTAVAEVARAIAERRGTESAEPGIENLPQAAAEVGDELAEHTIVPNWPADKLTHACRNLISRIRSRHASPDSPRLLPHHRRPRRRRSPHAIHARR